MDSSRRSERALLSRRNSRDGRPSGWRSSQEILTLPQFGREAYELVRLTPGVFGDASRQRIGNSFGLPQRVGPGGSNREILHRRKCSYTTTRTCSCICSVGCTRSGWLVTHRLVTLLRKVRSLDSHRHVVVRDPLVYRFAMKFQTKRSFRRYGNTDQTEQLSPGLYR